MWTLRFLNGPKKGSYIPLSPGSNTMGRSSTCTVQIQSPGISKVHAEIKVTDSEIILSDKNSSNGTYVNGVKIDQQKIEMGDQIALHDIIFDIVRSGVPERQNLSPANSAEDYPNTENPGTFQASPSATSSLMSWWDNYLNKVILTGVYKLPEWIEFRWVISLFAISFIVLVTVLSAFPLTQILKSSVEMESMNHAESIAVALAGENQSALVEGIVTSVSVDIAQRRPGVKTALIINAADGRIIAPVDQIHTYPKNSFIHRGRKTGQKLIEKLDSSTVGAMVPIKFFNPDTSSQAVMAYSVILYNMGSLSVGSNQTINLIVQSLFISIILGSIIFFFMYKMVVYPFESINEQLNQALKDDTKSISVLYQFPSLNSLCSNLNNLLERINSAQDQGSSLSNQIDRQHEMNNLVEMVGFACLCIRMDLSSIVSISSHFEEQTGLSTKHLLHNRIDQIDDNSLKLQLETAIQQITQDPSQIYSDSLECNGIPFQITAQGVFGTESVAYILVAFVPENEEEA